MKSEPLLYGCVYVRAPEQARLADCDRRRCGSPPPWSGGSRGSTRGRRRRGRRSSRARRRATGCCSCCRPSGRPRRRSRSRRGRRPRPGRPSVARPAPGAAVIAGQDRQRAERRRTSLHGALPRWPSAAVVLQRRKVGAQVTACQRDTKRTAPSSGAIAACSFDAVADDRGVALGGEPGGDGELLGQRARGAEGGAARRGRRRGRRRGGTRHRARWRRRRRRPGPPPAAPAPRGRPTGRPRGRRVMATMSLVIRMMVVRMTGCEGTDCGIEGGREAAGTGAHRPPLSALNSTHVRDRSQASERPRRRSRVAPAADVGGSRAERVDPRTSSVTSTTRLRGRLPASSAAAARTPRGRAPRRRPRPS